MVVLHLEFVGGEKIVRGFSRLKKLDDMSEAFELVRDEWYWPMEKEVFAAEGSPKRWKPLSPAYAAWKAKHYPGKTILQLTGRLIGSVTRETSDSVNIIRPHEALFTTKVPYAEKHQASRPFIQLTDKRKREVVRIIHRWALHLIEREI